MKFAPSLFGDADRKYKGLSINCFRPVRRKDPADGDQTSKDNPFPWSQESSCEKHMNDDGLQISPQPAVNFYLLL